MNRFSNIIIFSFVIMLLVPLAVIGCGNPQSTTSSVDFSVLVTDQSGNPLSGANVVSETEPEGQLKATGLTDQKGMVFFKGIKAGDYSFYVSRFDYIQEEFEITLYANRNYVVKMSPASN